MTFRIIQTPEQLAAAEANRPGPAVRVERFYDRGVRTWAAYPADAKGNQVGHTHHAHRKTDLTLNLADYPLWSN
jgi:hypothetical protein